MKIGSLYSEIDAIFEVTGVQAQQLCNYTDVEIRKPWGG